MPDHIVMVRLPDGTLITEPAEGGDPAVLKIMRRILKARGSGEQPDPADYDALAARLW